MELPLTEVEKLEKAGRAEVWVMLLGIPIGHLNCSRDEPGRN